MDNDLTTPMKVRKISSIGQCILNAQIAAMNLLEEEKSNLSKNEISTLLSYQKNFDFIPASAEFMKNIKNSFNDKQINFTIQNYLTWHYIDSILLCFFKTGDRLDRFKKCAVTEVDNIFVDGLKFMLSLKDMSVDQIRFSYFKFIGPKLMPYLYFYNKSDDDIDHDLSVLYDKGPNSQDIVTQFALSILLTETPDYYPMLVTCLAARKSKYGAHYTSLNENYFGNIFYKGLSGQLKTIEKGEILIKTISNIDNIKSYFLNRKNTYQMLSNKNCKINAAYINNTVVGIIGYIDNNKVINIHVDGDYRYRGIARKLLAKVLTSAEFLMISPIGDSFDFVKKISKYDKKKNLGIVTLDTLNGCPEKKESPSGISINDLNINPLEIVSDSFMLYVNKYYDVNSLLVKDVKIGNERIGYLIYDKENKKIVVLEVYDKYNNMGIAKMMLNSVLDYNIWSADIARTGLLFWFSKGIISGSVVYMSKSDSKLEQFAKKNKIIATVPKLHFDL